jgi:hypothetical protein
MTPLHGLCLAVVIPPLLAAAYYWALAVVALGRRSRPLVAADSPQTRFAILIPAHNESIGIGATLESCRNLDYPPDLIRIVVIADNCTDDTAIVARRAGADVLDRHDLDLRGKGQALAWALPRILRPINDSGLFDAVVLLDADCTMDRGALRAFAARLGAGQTVIQARVATANPDASPVSYAAAVGNLLENDLFYAPKDVLGGAVFLRGTGMAFAAGVLAAHPWAAYSLAEDSEYTLTLLQAGIRVQWAGEVTVYSDAPTDVAQLRVQRRRWAAALANPGSPVAPAGRWPQRLDARLTRLALSRPLILGATLLAAVITVTGYWWRPDWLAGTLAMAGAAALGLHVLYMLLGVVMLGVTKRRLRLLAGTPLVILRLVGIAVRGVIGMPPRTWVRTPRTADPPARGAA